MLSPLNSPEREFRPRSIQAFKICQELGLAPIRVGQDLSDKPMLDDLLGRV